MATLADALAAYVEKFEDSPTIVGLPADKEAEAITLLQDAVADDRPFLDDADFYNSMGLDPPPEDVET